DRDEMPRLFLHVLILVGLASVWCRPVSAQTLAPTQVEDTIVSVGELVDRYYFDAAMGAQVKEALREGLSEGRFPNLETAGDVIDTINHELQFLTHDDHLVISVARDAPTISTASNLAAIAGT